MAFHNHNVQPTLPSVKWLGWVSCTDNKADFEKAKVSNTDVDLALLEFCNTTITGMSESPAQLLMGRYLRSNLLMFLSHQTVAQLEKSFRFVIHNKTTISSKHPRLYHRSNQMTEYGTNVRQSRNQLIVVAKNVSPCLYIVKNTNVTKT